MEYYHIQSSQKDSNGYTTGEEVLTKESGAEIPKGNCYPYSNGFTKNEYFSTYEEARARFDYILQWYYKANTRACIDRRDEVTGEHFTYERR